MLIERDTKSGKEEEHDMNQSKQLIKRVLLEKCSTFAIISIFCIAAILLDPESDTAYQFLAKHSQAVMVQRLAPFIILLQVKAGLMIAFDFLNRFTAIEKTITLQACFYEMRDNLFCEKGHDYLYKNSSFFFIRRLLGFLHIYESIWLDKRIVDVTCEVSHTYQLKILKFSHLVVDVQEIINQEALQEQLDYVLGQIYQQQIVIDLIQERKDKKRKKLFIQYQEYLNVEDEKKQEYRFYVEKIKKEMDAIEQELQEQLAIQQKYELHKKSLQDTIEKMKRVS